MAEVLSQSEIDSLLSALSSGELEPEEIEVKDEAKSKLKKYDFRSPQKFSKEHIRTLEMVHDNFSRIVSNYLAGQLRKNVKINIQSVEQITYEEFIHSIPNPTVMSMFKMAPLQGSLIMEFNPQFTSRILDILLGGTGARKTQIKEFSDIDKNIMANISSELIEGFKIAWGDILKVEPEFESLETNPAVNQTLAPNEPVALITFSVDIGGDDTYMNLCIPYLSIEKLLDKLIVQFWFKNDDNEDDNKLSEKLANGLNPVELELSVELGNSNITIDDFLKLASGDIIKLNTKSNSPINIHIEGEECYIAKPGVIGKNKGVELLDIVDKDVNIYE